MKNPFEIDGVRHATINGQRLHLRLSPESEHSLLWINGLQPPLLLDVTAASFVANLIDAMWKFQQGDGDESEAVINYVVEKMHEQFFHGKTFGERKRKRKIRADLDRIFGTLMSIADGSCPHELGLNAKEIDYGKWSAPARMDLAVTYRCNLKCQKCYLNGKVGDMPPEQWEKVLEKLWQIGVPQVVFTGGEPLLYPGITKLIEKANMFVTGLVTNGTLLEAMAQELKNASLDYAQVTIECDSAEIHDQMTMVTGSHAQTVAGIKQALAVGLQVVTNTTLTKFNAHRFKQTMLFLHGLGVKNIACNSLICSGRGTSCKLENGLTPQELEIILIGAQEMADTYGINLQWYSPTCYDDLNPIELGFGPKACSAAAHNMSIQPDGTVLPCQSWPEPVGNILTDSWNGIWNHPTCQKLRAHGFKLDKCNFCEYVEICGGSCPLENSERLSHLKDGGK